jgi:hypothetical protein
MVGMARETPRAKLETNAEDGLEAASDDLRVSNMIPPADR